MDEYITALLNAMDHLTENEVTELTAEAAALHAAKANVRPTDRSPDHD